jgi:SpoVK/Ycf46/Vps4 family AAA+-type ATPase
MEQKFIVDGSNVFGMELPEGLVQNSVPLGVYFLKQAQGTVFLQKDCDSFELPEKVYGSVEAKTRKVLTSYIHATTSMGVMLTGTKGSGKSLQMKHIANTALEELKLPIIMITEPISGAAFQKFMDSIGEAVVLMDEFGKIFPAEVEEYDPANQDTVSQNSLLSFFDGVNTQKRIIILTENDTNKINEFIKERPGRVLYHWEYERLEEDTLEEYCEYHLNDKDKYLSDIKDFYSQATSFTIDTIKAIVDQCNIFKDEDLKTIVASLNIQKPDNRKYRIINYKEKHGVPITFNNLHINNARQVGGTYISVNDFSNLPNSEKFVDRIGGLLDNHHINLTFKSYHLGVTTFTAKTTFSGVDNLEIEIEVERDFGALAF